jgi:hypothetical protein
LSETARIHQTGGLGRICRHTAGGGPACEEANAGSGPNLTNVPLNQMTGVDPVFPPARAFVHQLRELGWIDGQTILFEARSLEGDPQRAPENRLPAIYGFREAVEAGGLVSYGTSIPGIFGQMARLTDRILKGAHPQDLPAEQAASFELVVNTRTANTLGLLVPSTMLALADEVIE